MENVSIKNELDETKSHLALARETEGELRTKLVRRASTLRTHLL